MRILELIEWLIETKNILEIDLSVVARKLDYTLILTSLELESLGLLPGEDVAAEVSVGGWLLEDWVLQLQVLQTEMGREQNREQNVCDVRVLPWQCGRV